MNLYICIYLYFLYFDHALGIFGNSSYMQKHEIENLTYKNRNNPLNKIYDMRKNLIFV